MEFIIHSQDLYDFMQVELFDETDISGWDGFFRFFSDKKYILLWEILALPKTFISNPICLLETSKAFLERETRVSTTNSVHDQNLESYQESIRLIHLGHLCHTFGKLVSCYGVNNSMVFYDLADRNFIHKKSTFWWEWYHFFKYEVDKDSMLTASLSEIEYKKFLKIIKTHLNINKKKMAMAIIKTSKLGQETNSIEKFDLILDQECAFKIWKDINESFGKITRNEIYKWGFNKSKLLGGARNWKKMRFYCLSI